MKNLVLGQIAAELGVEARAGSITTSGLRTLRLSDVELSRQAPDAPTISAIVPTALIELDAADLAAGRVTFQRVELYGARLTAVREEGQSWAFWTRQAPNVGDQGVQVAGHNCVVRLVEPGARRAVRVSALDFDLLAGGRLRQLSGPVSGRVEGPPEVQLNGYLRFTSGSDFSVNLRSQPVSLEALDKLPFPARLPAPALAGRARPRLRVDGYPGGLYVIAVEAELEDLALPEPLPAPIDGSLAVTANYDAQDKLLRLESATLDGERLHAFGSGLVDFAEAPAGIDLECRVEAPELPEMLAWGDSENPFALEDVTYTCLEGANITLEVTGNTQEPQAVASLRAPRLELATQPRADAPFAVDLDLSSVDAAWRFGDSQPVLNATLDGGVIRAPRPGLVFKDPQGQLSLAEGVVTADPLSFAMGGQRLSGKGSWDATAEEGSLSLAGTLTSLEDTALAELPGGLKLAGALSVTSAEAHWNAAGYHLSGILDASAAEVVYGTLIDKPAGLGARFIVEAESDSYAGPFRAKLELSSVDTLGRGDLVADADGLRGLDLIFDRLSLAALGQCLQGPLTLAQGEARDVAVSYHRATERATISAKVPDATMIVDRESTLVAMSRAEIAGAIGFGGAQPQGDFTVRAARCALPEADYKWALLAGGQDERPRGRWEFDINIDELSFPPWDAEGVEALAYVDHTGLGFRSFRANADEGLVSGAYHSYHESNSYSLDVEWRDTAAVLLLEHLGFPRVLEGTSAGRASFTVDRDDEHSLTGSGAFEVHQGRFSADFLLSQLGATQEAEVTALPPSLRFERLAAGLEMDEGRVRTPEVSLESEGVHVAGTGSFEMGGDLDYEFDVRIDPETAQDMSALRETLNLKGHRIANQDIALTIRVSGPLRDPKGEVRGGPARGTTLVTGTLEVASDVVDIPRKILVDLLKIGGGIVRGPN